MKNQSIDGIQKRTKIVGRPKRPIRIVSRTTMQRRVAHGNRTGVLHSRKFGLTIAAVAVAVVFISGMWVESGTHATLADSGSQTTTPGGVAANLGTLPTSTLANIPTEEFYNLSLDQIEGYLENTFKSPEAKEADKFAERKQKLTEYLQEKKSPLAEITETLVHLKHWQMVLAISNSESSLGKRCYNNNCSGIGVEPGHPQWKDYDSKAAWAIDLDRLIEKRYGGWTLEEMNGVYNKPGSENWLLASKTILEELQERGIE